MSIFFLQRGPFYDPIQSFEIRFQTNEMSTECTLNHLARQLRVHPSTVSLALSNNPKVAARTRQRVHDLAQRLNYSPNLVARSLRQRSTKTLGVLFPCVSLPYYASLLDALDAEADARGLHLEVHFHQWNAGQERSAMRTLLQRRVDGVILLPATRQDECAQMLRECLPAKGQLPVSILAASKQQSFPDCVRGIVDTDLRVGSKLLGEHLVERNHRRVALLLPERGSHLEPKTREKTEGLQAAFDQCKGAELALVEPTGRIESEIPRREHLQGGGIVDQHFVLAGDLARGFLKLSPRPTAVVATDEPIAQALLTHLGAQGLRVPADVSVACYDGTYLSACGMVPLTCVAQPLDQMARSLIELVTSNRHDDAGCRVVKPPSTLIVRASVACLGVENVTISPGSKGARVPAGPGGGSSGSGRDAQSREAS